MTVLIDTLSRQPVRAICDAHDNRPDALLEILHAVQGLQGYLAEAALLTIANALNISRAEIHGVVSFYHDFHTKPQARHVLKICRAEACQAVGSEALAAYAQDQIKAQARSDAAGADIAIEAVYCLGNCALGPAVMLDGDLHGRVTPQRLDALTNDLLATGLQK